MLKERILKKIENINIVYEELESYRYDKDPYCVGYPLCEGSGCGRWSEEEAFTAKKEKLIEWLKDDLIGDYVEVSDSAHERDCDTGRLTKSVIKWLETGKDI